LWQNAYFQLKLVPAGRVFAREHYCGAPDRNHYSFFDTHLADGRHTTRRGIAGQGGRQVCLDPQLDRSATQVVGANVCVEPYVGLIIVRDRYLGAGPEGPPFAAFHGAGGSNSKAVSALVEDLALVAFPHLELEAIKVRWVAVFGGFWSRRLFTTAALLTHSRGAMRHRKILAKSSA